MSLPCGWSNSAGAALAHGDRVEVLRQQALQERARVGAVDGDDAGSEVEPAAVAHDCSSNAGMRVGGSRCAAAAAVSNACALFRHSRSSSAGSESATIPAPACSVAC